MIQIRTAVPDDSPAIFRFINELAEYERAPEQVVTTPEQIRRDGFEHGHFECLIADRIDTPVGFALFYHRYSTWKGLTLYLEDLYVTPDVRGHGYGMALLDRVLEVAESRKCQMVHWQVLDWNEPAIGFYQQIGTEFDAEWINCNLRSPSAISNARQQLRSVT